MTGAAPGARISPTDWMLHPEAQALLREFARAGHGARFVGGCVRDTILGRPVSDIDIATTARPDMAMAVIGGAGMKAIPTGIAHGTVTAVGHRHFEITTLRRDVSTDGRRATVAFTDDWREDAARRDFTMNALFLDADGKVTDYFDGLTDLAAGRVRFVGDPATRLGEDYLRLLRFFRFHAHLGRGAPDTLAVQACVSAAPMLARLSVERIRHEMLRLLQAPDPLPTLVLMRDTGVLGLALAEAGRDPRLDRLERLVADYGTAEDALLRLMALLPDDGAAVSALADHWKLSNAERERMLAMVAAGACLAPEMDEPALRRAIWRHGAAAVGDAIRLAAAGTPAELASRWSVLAQTARATHVPDFPLRGRDGLALGLGPGPALGEALAAVERWWAEGDFQAGRDACLQRLKALIRQDG